MRHEEFVLSEHKITRMPNGTPAAASGRSERAKPGWADGLRKLYDSVVDEPLPDSFDDLLKKLDGDGKK